MGGGGGIVAGGGTSQLFKAIRPQTISCSGCNLYYEMCYGASASVDANGNTSINGVPGTYYYAAYPNQWNGQLNAILSIGGLSVSWWNTLASASCTAQWAP